MTERNKFNLQILEKLGAPLLAAIIEVSSKEGDSKEGENSAKQAEMIAGLLARSVKMGLALGSSLNLKSSDAEADAARLALTALSSSLVANFYRQTGRAPGDNEISRMVTAFEAILSFSDNFAPAADNILRLQSLDPSTFLVDENQIFIQYTNVFVPVVNAVAAYSFGRQEKKLVQEIAGRLVEKAQILRGAMLDDAEEKDGRRAELQILSGLVPLFVESYNAEKSRLLALGEKERADMARSEDGGLSLEAVWTNFDTRAAMVELLSQTIAADAVSSAGQRSASPSSRPVADVQQAAPATQAPPPQTPAQPQEAPTPSEPAQPQPQGEAQQEQPAEDKAQSYNPMSFFRPPKEGEEDAGS